MVIAAAIFRFMFSPLGRVVGIAAAGLAVILWLRWDAAEGERARIAAETLRELSNDLNRSRPGPVLHPDECRRRLLDGRGCAR